MSHILARDLYTFVCVCVCVCVTGLMHCLQVVIVRQHVLNRCSVSAPLCVLSLQIGTIIHTIRWNNDIIIIPPYKGIINGIRLDPSSFEGPLNHATTPLHPPVACL